MTEQAILQATSGTQRFVGFTFVALALCFLWPARLLATEIRLVAGTGQLAPGTTSRFGSFINSPPAINAHGQVAFRASFTAQGPEGIWSEGGGNGLQLVALHGQPAPGTEAGTTFRYFAESHGENNASASRLIINNAGQIPFRATLVGPNVTAAAREGLWIADPIDGIKMIARSGQTLPGSTRPIVRFQHHYLALNQHGDLALNGRYTLTNLTMTGLWAWDPDHPDEFRFIGQQGDPVQGSTTGERFYSVAYDGAVLDGAGIAFFKTGIGDRFAQFTNRNAVATEGIPGTPSFIARDGGELPGGPAGAKFTGIFPFDMAVNSSGQYAFGASTTIGSSIWTGSPHKGITLRVLAGERAAGTPGDVTFSSLGSPEINASGQIAFAGLVSGPGITNTNSFGIWAEDRSGRINLVAREGDPVPGAPGMVFGDDRFPVFEDIVLNAKGQVAFQARVRPASGERSTAQGIWATTTQGELMRIVLTDDPFVTDTGQTASYSLLWFSGGTGNDEGRSSGFSDLGHVAFSGDSYGVYVSYAVAVPEPSAVVVFLLAFAPIGAFHRETSRRRAFKCRIGA